MDRSVAKEIQRSLELAVERESWDRNGALYVSDMKHAVPLEDGGDCRVKLWAKLQDLPQEPLKPGIELMFGIGDMLHEKLVEWLEEHLPEDWQIVGVEERVEIHGLRGRYDLKLRLPDGNTVLIDFKTKRGGAFQYLDYDGAKEPDRRQVQTYMKAENADLGLLVYVDREGQNWIRIFEVYRADDLVEEDAATLEYVRTKAKEGERLEREDYMQPVLSRANNKGKDSLKLSWSWQVEWCPLEACCCRKSYDAGGLDIVGKAAAYGKVIGWCREQDDGRFVLEMKEKWDDPALRQWLVSRLDHGNYKRH